VARLLDGLIAEELGPLVEALSFEVERDAEVGLMGTELAGNLANEKLSKSLADHSVLVCWVCRWTRMPSAMN